MISLLCNVIYLLLGLALLRDEQKLSLGELITVDKYKFF